MEERGRSLPLEKSSSAEAEMLSRLTLKSKSSSISPEEEDISKASRRRRSSAAEGGEGLTS